MKWQSERLEHKRINNTKIVNRARGKDLNEEVAFTCNKCKNSIRIRCYFAYSLYNQKGDCIVREAAKEVL